MTESELEDDVIVPEVLPEQKFHVMVKEASLDESRANYLLQNFSNHFKEAAEWAKKSKDIIVTKDNQTVMMEMARTGRLFLAKKRQEIEKARKWMKEPALREGQAIDKIANLLKDTIIPTEEHLYRQENFTKLRKEAEDARLLEEARLKEELRLQEQAKKDSEERERLRIENENLRKIAEQKETANREAIQKINKENEEKIRMEREKVAVVERELLRKKQEELRSEAEKIKSQQLLKEGTDTYKLIKFRENLKLLIESFPNIKESKLIRISEDTKSHLWMAHSELNQVIEEEE